MMTNYREMLGIMTLEQAINLSKENRNLKQKKAIKNIKWCADDQWQFVNSWYDCKDESAREYMMNARDLFVTIYEEAQRNIYDEGCVHFGSGAESYLKDIRFCGKDFLQKVTFYYTAKLLEDSVGEVDGTDEDAERVLKDLKSLKIEIYGPENTDDILSLLCTKIEDGDKFVETIAKYVETPVKTTRKGEKWISISRNFAIVLSIFLKNKDSNLSFQDSRTKITYSNENVELIVNLGTNPYLWSIKK